MSAAGVGLSNVYSKRLTVCSKLLTVYSRLLTILAHRRAAFLTWARDSGSMAAHRAPKKSIDIRLTGQVELPATWNHPQRE